MFGGFYLPMLANPGVQALMALAAESTIAGNFQIPGAVSDIIVFEDAEKSRWTQAFFVFIRVVISLGFLNLLVY